jgi:outer membrane protein assembly factor BamB
VPGEVALVEATPNGYRELGRFTPPNGPTSRVVEAKASDAKNGKARPEKGGKTWAYPSIAHGRLYIRDWNCLWCYDVKAK